MRKITRLTESDLRNIVKKIIKESGRYKGSMATSDFIDMELLDDVIQRMNHLYCENCGDEYKEALRDFNMGWTIDPRRVRRM